MVPHIMFVINLSLFEPFFSPFISSIVFPNDLTAYILKIDNVRLSSQIVLKNVLYVPSFKDNLVSITALIGNINFEILFSHHSCLI